MAAVIIPLRERTRRAAPGFPRGILSEVWTYEWPAGLAETSRWLEKVSKLQRNVRERGASPLYFFLL